MKDGVPLPPGADDWLPDYWERRYLSGGSSGKGSVGKSRAFKWYVIELYTGPIAKYQGNILDVGCGDLSFWEGRTHPRYLGLDISPTVLLQDRERRPEWAFHCVDCCIPSLEYRADVVLCMDLLFHIMDDAAYVALVRNLGRWTGRWLFVHTWETNPLVRVGLFRRDGSRTTDHDHQSYRPPEGMIELLRAQGLVLASAYANPNNKWSKVYVFKKVKE